MDNPLIKNWSPPVAGSLWGRAQLVGMIGLAGVCAVVIYGYVRPPAPPVVRPVAQLAEAPGQPPPPPPRQFVAQAPPDAMPAPVGHAPTGGGVPSDPLKDEMRRKAYTSLFASNLVGEAKPTPGSAVTPPSLDATADAAVRALQRNGTPPLGAVSPVSTPPVSTPVTDVRPVSTPPIRSPGPLHPVLESTVIDTVLQIQLDGSSNSPVTVQLTNPLYSWDGKYVLIPAGTKVVGESKAIQHQGESRLAVTFHRLIFPDGRTEPLDHDLGLDQAGDTGIHDQINRHIWAMFGAATAVGLIQGLSQVIGTAGYSGGRNNSTVIVSGPTNGISQVANQVMSQFTNRMPTITIRPGHRMKVYVVRDFALPAYVHGGERG